MRDIGLTKLVVAKHVVEVVIFGIVEWRKGAQFGHKRRDAFKQLHIICGAQGDRAQIKPGAVDAAELL